MSEDESWIDAGLVSFDNHSDFRLWCAKNGAFPQRWILGIPLPSDSQPVPTEQ